jgi:hypothetical protein
LCSRRGERVGGVDRVEVMAGMAVPGRIPVPFGLVFPHGAFVIGVERGLNRPGTTGGRCR